MEKGLKMNKRAGTFIPSSRVLLRKNCSNNFGWFLQKKCVPKQNIPEMVYLHLGKIKHRSRNEKPFEIRKSHLARVPDSMIAKYFCGNFESQGYYLPIADTGGLF